MRYPARAETMTGMSMHYLIECYWPDVSEAAFMEGATQAETAAGQLRATGRTVSFLGSVLVPDDQVSFWLFAGHSLADAREAGSRAGLSIDRITECLDFIPAPASATETDLGHRTTQGDTPLTT
jgi:hypothetical protein